MWAAMSKYGSSVTGVDTEWAWIVKISSGSLIGSYGFATGFFGVLVDTFVLLPPVFPPGACSI